jgi:hypothetical protein
LLFERCHPSKRIQADSSTAESQGNGFRDCTQEKKALNVQDGKRQKKKKMTATHSDDDGGKKKKKKKKKTKPGREMQRLLFLSNGAG